MRNIKGRIDKPCDCLGVGQGKDDSKVASSFLLWITEGMNMSFIELPSTASLEAKEEMNLLLRMLPLTCPLFIQVGWRSMYIETRDLSLNIHLAFISIERIIEVLENM